MLTCSAACSKGTIADAFAARFSTPAEYECTTAQFSPASCGYRSSFPLLRFAARQARTGPRS